MTITAKYTPTTTQSRTAQRYQRPAILTAEQIAMVVLVTFISCAVVSVFGLLVGAAMALALMVSNANLCATIADIEREEDEEGHR